MPPYVRKSRTVAATVPWLYLHGVSSGHMQEALSILLGEEAKGLSPAALGLVSVSDGLRESKASWLEILRDLQARGLEAAPVPSSHPQSRQ